jgi:hypothetical protein
MVDSGRQNERPRHRLVSVEEDISLFFNGLMPAHHRLAQRHPSVLVLPSLEVGAILNPIIEMVVPMSTASSRPCAHSWPPSLAPSIRCCS